MVVIKVVIPWIPLGIKMCKKIPRLVIRSPDLHRLVGNTNFLLKNYFAEKLNKVCGFLMPLTQVMGIFNTS